MKIFITSFTREGKEYAGPEIIALSWDIASGIAESSGLTLVGELTDIIHQDIIESDCVIH